MGEAGSGAVRLTYVRRGVLGYKNKNVARSFDFYISCWSKEETLTDEEREIYFSLTTAIEKLTFKVDIAGNRIKKQSNGVKQINKLLNA